jgi:hypothetical protein
MYTLLALAHGGANPMPTPAELKLGGLLTVADSKLVLGWWWKWSKGFAAMLIRLQSVMGLAVVLVYGVVLVAGIVVFDPVNRNSYLLRADVACWVWVVLWDAVMVVRLLVVVVCCCGMVLCGGGFVGSGSMWCVRGVCG